MTGAVYLAIVLHFARKTVRKISESKEERARILVARMEENGIKIYRDMYADPSKCLVGYNGYSNMPHTVAYSLRYVDTDHDKKTPGSMKDSYDIIKDIIKNHSPSIMVMNYPPAKDRWVSATPGASR